jgi:hypothetical protein
MIGRAGVGGFLFGQQQRPGFWRGGGVFLALVIAVYLGMIAVAMLGAANWMSLGEPGAKSAP